MAARQMRRFLLCELLIYATLASWLMSHAEWPPSQALGFVLLCFLGLRLFVVAITFSFVVSDSESVPPSLRVGPVRAAAMALEEYAALLLLFTVIQPFESFWLAPDRLAKHADGRLPLLLIHGYQCNRGLWFWLRPKLEAAGWTVATHNLEPIWAGIDDYVDGIAGRIDEVLAATGAPRVILIGHSMGGLACRAYLRRCGSDKVARLITLASPHHGTRLARLGLGLNARQLRIGSFWLTSLSAAAVPPGSVSIYSCHDNYVVPQQAGSTLAGASNIAIGGISHLSMVFSSRVLGKLLRALETPR